MTCNCKEISRDKLENWILDTFFENFFNDNSIAAITNSINDRLKSTSQSNVQYINAMAHLTELVKQRDNLVDSIAKIGANETIAYKIKDLEQQIKETTAFIDKFTEENILREVSEDEVRKLITDLRENMKDPESFASLRFILSQYIEEIIVTNETVAVTFKVAAVTFFIDKSLDIENIYINTARISRTKMQKLYSHIDEDSIRNVLLSKISLKENTDRQKSYHSKEKQQNNPSRVQVTIAAKKDNFIRAIQEKPTPVYTEVGFMVGAGGFEPPKLKATDLQSAPFGHSGTLPYLICISAF